MEVYDFENNRCLKKVQENYDLVVVGGGLTGVCCAITAARAGIKVVLIQDRPVPGGNASSEVRLWALGATSHMGNNNRWSREGGVIDEILTENTYRNKEGNPVLFDMVLIEKVLSEPNIVLHLNTAVYDIEKQSSSQISAVKAYNSSSETHFEISGTIFADCSGDGIISYLSGVPYRMGAEDKAEYGERFAPDKEKYGELMGHSIFFYMKDAGKPIRYVTPDFALKNVEKLIPKIQNEEYFSIHHHGCKYWWLEYGGRLDTIHDTEQIKLELWKVIYGIWGYIKNSGEFPEMENYTLEWVGLIPGKRESRRFKGLYTLTQQDIINQNKHDDAVAFGGWSIDLHPADGLYAGGRGCNQWHSKGVYQIPFRCFLAKEVENLMFGGRIISASHVANGSTRVMCTSAHGGQAVGMAAAICVKDNLSPIQILENNRIKKLQNELNKAGQSIADIPIDYKENFVNEATLTASSTLKLSEIAENGGWLNLGISAAQLLPVKAHQQYSFKIKVNAEEATPLEVQLRKSEDSANYTPELILETKNINLTRGEQLVEFIFEKTLDTDSYAFVTFMANPKVSIRESANLISGVMTVFNAVSENVSNNRKQTPQEGIGVDEFEFWIPNRRPEGKNIAMEITPALEAFETSNIGNGYVRPWRTVNAWVADLKDKTPELKIQWNEEKEISEIKLFFDTDYDHAMENAQYGHPEDVMPFCVRNYRIKTLKGELLKEISGNYQTINTINFETAIRTDGFIIEVAHPSENVPASIFEMLVK